jgi:hypothetical protein
MSNHQNTQFFCDFWTQIMKLVEQFGSDFNKLLGHDLDQTSRWSNFPRFAYKRRQTRAELKGVGSQRLQVGQTRTFLYYLNERLTLP